MKVSELIEQLQDLDGDLLVVVSQDPEGNGFDTLADVCTNQRYSDVDHHVGLDHLNEDLEEAGFGEEDLMEDGVPCVVLWP
jgi:hypothetical protein